MLLSTLPISACGAFGTAQATLKCAPISLANCRHSALLGAPSLRRNGSAEPSCAVASTASVSSSDSAESLPCATRGGAPAAGIGTATAIAADGCCSGDSGMAVTVCSPFAACHSAPAAFARMRLASATSCAAGGPERTSCRVKRCCSGVCAATISADLSARCVLSLCSSLTPPARPTRATRAKRRATAANASRSFASAASTRAVSDATARFLEVSASSAALVLGLEVAPDELRLWERSGHKSSCLYTPTNIGMSGKLLAASNPASTSNADSPPPSRTSSSWLASVNRTSLSSRSLSAVGVANAEAGPDAWRTSLPFRACSSSCCAAGASSAGAATDSATCSTQPRPSVPSASCFVSASLRAPAPAL
eukprot:3731373-Pleurochrysis_carterae.AAC.2